MIELPEAYGLTDRGLVRPVNQDAFLIDPRLGLYLVADGMGGAKAGEKASALALETVVEHFSNSNARPTLEDAYKAAHAAVKQRAAADFCCAGMGTTLVGVHIGPDGVDLASAGDSRAYLSSHGKLELLTKDHSWVEEVGRRIGLCEDVLKKHPFRHVITMAIGVDSELDVRHRKLEPVPGSRLLLCSDGLHGYVAEETIGDALRSERSLESCAHQLIEASKQAGAPDNVTVVLIDF
jgi:protein phosphatase